MRRRWQGGFAGDGGTDADAATDGSAGDAQPTCTGDCRDYVEGLRLAIEAALPARCDKRSLQAGLSCVPSSTTDCPTNTREEAEALEVQIRAYLNAARPEIHADTPLDIEGCVCRVYSE